MITHGDFIEIESVSADESKEICEWTWDYNKHKAINRLKLECLNRYTTSCSKIKDLYGLCDYIVCPYCTKVFVLVIPPGEEQPARLDYFNDIRREYKMISRAAKEYLSKVLLKKTKDAARDVEFQIGKIL